MDMIYFGGCSITMGAGYPAQQQDYRIYPNLVAAAVNSQADNQAEGGSSNLKIFTRAAKALLDKQHNTYFVQWSALHRHWVYPSPKHGFYIGSYADDNIADRTFVAQYQLLNHDYSNIIALIDYTRILQQLAKDAGCDIWFVNGLLPWAEDMLLPSLDTSSYAQHLYQGLTSKELDDYSERLRNNLELIDWSQWINPWNSIAGMQIDNAPLDTHPGPNTHAKIANVILEIIGTQNES
jgi:hypothetical protein